MVTGRHWQGHDIKHMEVQKSQMAIINVLLMCLTLKVNFSPEWDAVRFWIPLL